MTAYRDNARRRVSGLERSGGAAPAAAGTLGVPARAQMRADVARFFTDLRRAVGVGPMQIASRLTTSPDVIAALERCDLARLPSWPETSRIVMAYTAWAGVDGRPVLSALAALIRDAEHERRSQAHFAAVRPALAASGMRLRQASQVIAAGARRLPREALSQARERPVRTFYALSLPMALLFLALNSGLVRHIVGHAPRPLIYAVVAVRDTVAVYFPPVHEGLRWVDVSDPRSRRGDKQPSEER